MHTVTRCGDNVIADIDSATGTAVRTYVTPMLDANVSMTIAGATPTTYYYSQDERMSVMNLTDSAGAVAQSYGYSAYGDKIDSLTQHTTTAPLPNRYTYTGRESSEVSGDYYFRYRWYGAASGSFYGRDPLGFVDGMSVYAGWFAAGIKVDPLGKQGRPPRFLPCTRRYRCGALVASACVNAIPPIIIPSIPIPGTGKSTPCVRGRVPNHSWVCAYTCKYVAQQGAGCATAAPAPPAPGAAVRIGGIAVNGRGPCRGAGIANCPKAPLLVNEVLQPNGTWIRQLP